jgi:hypothetical protein
MRTGQYMLLASLALAGCGDNIGDLAGQQHGQTASALQPAAKFDCVPAPNVKLPASVSPGTAGLVSMGQRPCPQGQVPQPRPLYAPKGRPPSASAGTSTTVQRLDYSGPTFAYAGADKYTSLIAPGALTVMTVEWPTLWNNDVQGSHSLAEISVSDAPGSGGNTVEVGWIVGRGDTHPELFVYHWVNGQETCYNNCGFVQVCWDLWPGMDLSFLANTGMLWPFGIIHTDFGVPAQAGWWVYFVAGWVGYFPDTDWTNPPFTDGPYRAWFGEVAAPAGQPPCSQMGNGKWGHEDGAARMGTLNFFSMDGPTYWLANANLKAPEFQFDATWYVTGNSFAYGGPGGGASCP